MASFDRCDFLRWKARSLQSRHKTTILIGQKSYDFFESNLSKLLESKNIVKKFVKARRMRKKHYPKARRRRKFLRAKSNTKPAHSKSPQKKSPPEIRVLRIAYPKLWLSDSYKKKVCIIATRVCLQRIGGWMILNFL